MADATEALRSALDELRQIQELLDSYERTRDKKKLAEVSQKMKEMLPKIKQMSQDPECKTKQNAPLLIELSNGMKDAVARTKSLGTARPPNLASDMSSTVNAESTSSVGLTNPPKSLPEPLEGYLNKLGDKGLLKSWKKRWFLQKEHKLYYFESKEELNPKGFIDLTQMIAISESPKTKWGFDITTPERVYHLQALKESDKLYWNEGLKKWKEWQTKDQSRTKSLSLIEARKSVSRTASLSAISLSPHSDTLSNLETSGNLSKQDIEIPSKPSEKEPSRFFNNIPTSRSSIRVVTDPPVEASPIVSPVSSQPVPVSQTESLQTPTAAPQTEEPHSSVPDRQEEIRQLQEKLLSLQRKFVPSPAEVSTAAPLPKQTAEPASETKVPYQDVQNATDSIPTEPVAVKTENQKSLENNSENGVGIANSSQMSRQLEEELRKKEEALHQVKDKLRNCKQKLRFYKDKAEGLSEDVASLQKELQAKNEQIASLSVSHPTSGNGKDEEIAQLRQATHAHQTQNALLSSEIKRLEREKDAEVAAKGKMLAELQIELDEVRQENQRIRQQLLQGGKGKAHGEADGTELENLKQKYFFALAVGIKLNLALQGRTCNVDAMSLYHKAQSIPPAKWNEWILQQYQRHEQ